MGGAGKYPVFNAYKGLQKPLIFKGFKGKFIYYGFACLTGSLVACIVVSLITSFLWGGATLVTCMVGGLALIAHKQKKGLHKKKIYKGVYIVTNIVSMH